MVTKNMKIEIQSGLEARPVAMFVQTASQYDSSIYVEHENKRVYANSIMVLISLGLAAGEFVFVSSDGTDEEAAIEGIEKFLSNTK